MMRLLLFIQIFIINSFAIIDIATIDFGDKAEGFSGSAYGSFQKKRGNTEKDESEYGGRIEYDTPQTITWLQAAVEKDKSGGSTTDDNAFIHLRHIHQVVNPDWAMEFYTQAKKEKFQRIKNRTVFGVGPRYKIADSKQYGKLFVGLSAMDEEVSYTDNGIDPDEHNYRASSYLSYTLSLEKNLEFSYLGYYQPKIDNGSDYTASSSAELTIHLIDVIDLSYLLEFDYDTNPAHDVLKRDTRQKLSFVYRFGEGDPFSAYAQTLLNSSDMNTSVIEAKKDAKEEESAKRSLEGEWVSESKRLSLLPDGKGSFTKREGPYIEKFEWRLLPTEAKEGQVLLVQFMDEEGRPGRAENYLWSEETLVSLTGGRVNIFSR